MLHLQLELIPFWTYKVRQWVQRIVARSSVICGGMDTSNFEKMALIELYELICVRYSGFRSN